MACTKRVKVARQTELYDAKLALIEAFEQRHAKAIDGEMYLYNKIFNMYDAIKDTDTAGAIREMKLFFAIEDTEVNKKALKMSLGKTWETKFIRKWREDDQAKEGGAWYWFPIADKIRGLTGERIATIMQLGFVNSLKTRQEVASGFDKFVQIVIVVAITYVTGGTAGPSAGAWMVAAMQIMTIVTGVPMSKEMQIAMAVVSLGSNYSSAASAGKSMATSQVVLSTFQIGMQIAEMNQQKGFEKAIGARKDILDKFAEEDALAVLGQSNYYYSAVPAEEAQKQYRDPLGVKGSYLNMYKDVMMSPGDYAVLDPYKVIG